MNHQDIDDPLKALREELADKAPSPEFAAKVRQGIDAAGDIRGASWLPGWRWLVPVAAVMVVAAFVMSRPRSESPVQVAVKAPAHAEAPIMRAPESVVPPAPGAAAQGVKVAEPSHSLKLRRASENPSTREPEHLRTREPEDPFPEVITNQAAILRALWARVDANVPLVESVATTSPEAVPEIVINPIEISPIVIQWLGDPQTAPSAPVIRKSAADKAERSEK